MSAHPPDFTVALEGCAGRAAFHVGVLEWFEEQGLRPSALAGASAGSIVAAGAALGRIGELRDLWLSAAGSRVFRPERLLRLGWPLAMSEIIGSAMEAAFAGITLGDSRLPLTIPVTHVTRGQLERRLLTREDPVPVTRAVLGSCFIPGPYHRVIRIDGRTAFDGAWTLRTPVDAAPSGARVLAVVANPQGHLKTGYFRPGVMDPPPGCRVLHPQATLPVGPYDMSLPRMRETMAAGRQAAERFARAADGWLSGAGPP